MRVQLPSDSRFIRVARAVAGGVAAVAGLGMDDLDDLRIAVDELCTALVEVGGGHDVDLEFAIADGILTVNGQVRAAPGAAFDGERLRLSEQILAVACDDYTLGIGDSIARFTLHKRAGWPSSNS